MSLFCKRALQKRQYSVKETHYVIDPTNHRHPIRDDGSAYVLQWECGTGCCSVLLRVAIELQ